LSPEVAVSEPPFHGVSSPTTYQTKAATCIGVASPNYAASSGFLNLLTLSSALVLSALSHAESVPGVEALRGFPLPVAATVFTARCPQASRRLVDSASTRDPKNAPSTPPPQHRTAQGFLHLEGPFATNRFYPGFVGRAPLSLVAPSRISPLEPRPRVVRETSSHGLVCSSGRIHRRKRSTEFQRTRRSACLFRVLPPSLGLMSWVL
jgi:hypothetical protein